MGQIFKVNSYVKPNSYNEIFGEYYISKEKWEDISLEQAIYVPSMGYDENPIYIYTKKDFIDLFDGDSDLGKMMFENIHGEHPTIYVFSYEDEQLAKIVEM